jgi:hypothetical protein
MPPLEAMRQHIEVRWQQHGSLLKKNGAAAAGGLSANTGE